MKERVLLPKPFTTRKDRTKPTTTEKERVNPATVVITDLLANPDKFNGKKIRTTGIRVSGFEVNALSESTIERDGAVYLKEPTIWLEGDTVGNEQDCFKGKVGFPPATFCTVDVTGIFEYGDRYGHTGGYKFQIRGGITVTPRGRIEAIPVEIEPKREQKPEPKFKPEPTIPQATEVVPVANLTLKADDLGFYPSSELRVKKGAKVFLIFEVSQDNVYFAGLDFRSSKFKTKTVKPGNSITVEFIADESFEFTSYWPATNTRKVTGKIIVE